MNKTIQINLAGLLFHIDEDAYLKLYNYLEAIRSSFAQSEGKDEIMADIEARVAELFNQKIKNPQQVLTNSEVDHVINMMGQPKDYQIDEEYTEADETRRQTKTTKSIPKPLYRDKSFAFVGGVSSGLGYYFGVDPIWIRLSWILFTLFSSGVFLLVYLALWILTPEAKTTTEKLAMKGKPININTIKEGFNGVAEKVRKANYKDLREQLQRHSYFTFARLKRLINAFLKLFSKTFGLFLIVIASISLIALCLGFIVVGVFGLFDIPWIASFKLGLATNFPAWLFSLSLCFVIGIPFVVLLIIGLKIVFSNLKSIGTPIKLGMVGLWFLSIISLFVFGMQQLKQFSTVASTNPKAIRLPISVSDTLKIKFNNSSIQSQRIFPWKMYRIQHSEAQKNILINNIRFDIQPTDMDLDTLPKIRIQKIAKGTNYEQALEAARAINYSYKVVDNTLWLDRSAWVDYGQRIKNQKLEITLLIPNSMVLQPSREWYRYCRLSAKKKFNFPKYGTHKNTYVQMQEGELNPINILSDNQKSTWKYANWEEDRLLSRNTLRDTTDSNLNLKIDEDGFRLKNEEIDIKIDRNGVKISTED